MPFANAGRSISGLLQHLRQGQATFFNQTRSAHAGKHTAHSVAKCHSPGQKTVSGWRANGRRTVCVHKTNPSFCHLIQIGRLDFRFRLVATHVPVSQVICQDHDDVWQLFRIWQILVTES